MIDYTPLIQIWPSLTGTTLDKLIQLNAMTVNGSPVDVPTQIVEDYLVSNNKLAVLQDYILNPPASASQQTLMAVNYMLVIISGVDGTTIMTSDPAILQLVTSLLLLSVSDPNTGINQTDAANLLAMTIPEIAWWQANGFQNAISLADLVNAGNLF